jgi:hypothetical protein
MAKETPHRTARGGSPTADRVAARTQRDALRRMSMPGGGEVYTGDVASRSLKALGARAMTVDKSIIVSDEFDPNRPEDQALFAHEQYHVEHSGGEGTHEARDAEEVAARAVERMVLHRASHGGATSHEAAHATPGAGVTGGGISASGTPQNVAANTAAQRGYAALRAQGLTHEQVIEQLAREFILSMDARGQLDAHRTSDKKAWR